jgi:hypothetical protein
MRTQSATTQNETAEISETVVHESRVDVGVQAKICKCKGFVKGNVDVVPVNADADTDVNANATEACLPRCHHIIRSIHELCHPCTTRIADNVKATRTDIRLV